MTTFNQYLGDTMLNEGWKNPNSHAILPAGRVLFNKNKVTPDHAVSKQAGVWGDGDQSVRTYEHQKESWPKGGNLKVETKHFHVSSSGHYSPDGKYDKKIGQTEDFHHDQSGNTLPSGKLVGVSNYTDGKKVAHHGEDHSKTAAPFHVYK